MRQEDESEGIEVAWGEHFPVPDTTARQLTAITTCVSDKIEDQQRISAFSKFNTRLSSIQDELKKLQVSPRLTLALVSVSSFVSLNICDLVGLVVDIGRKGAV
jgi:hypothetical protein